MTFEQKQERRPTGLGSYPEVCLALLTNTAFKPGGVRDQPQEHLYCVIGAHAASHASSNCRYGTSRTAVDHVDQSSGAEWTGRRY